MDDLKTRITQFLATFDPYLLVKVWHKIEYLFNAEAMVAISGGNWLYHAVSHPTPPHVHPPMRSGMDDP